MHAHVSSSPAIRITEKLERSRIKPVDVRPKLKGSAGRCSFRVLSLAARRSVDISVRLPEPEGIQVLTGFDCSAETLRRALQSLGLDCLTVGLHKFMELKFEMNGKERTGEWLLRHFGTGRRDAENFRSLLKFAGFEITEFDVGNRQQLREVLRSLKTVDYGSIGLHEFLSLKFSTKIFKGTGETLLKSFSDNRRDLESLDELLRLAGYERFDINSRQHLQQVLKSVRGLDYSTLSLGKFRGIGFRTGLFKGTGETLLRMFGSGTISRENLDSLLECATVETRPDSTLEERHKIMLEFWVSQKWYKKCSKNNKEAIFVEGDGYVRPRKRGDWGSEHVRVEAVRWLANNVLDKPCEMTAAKDFKLYKLGGLLARYYHDSPLLALFHAGLIDRQTLEQRVLIINKNELKGMEKFFLGKGWCVEGRDFGLEDNEVVFLNGRWENEEVRVEAIRVLVNEVLAKNASDVTHVEMHENHLGNMLIHYYGNSQHLAFYHAGLISRETLKSKVRIIDKNNPKGMERFFLGKGWYVDGASVGLSVEEVVFLAARWGDANIRREAVRFLVEQVLDAEPTNAKHDDFIEHGLKTLLYTYYGCSPFKAIKDAYPEVNGWEMTMVPMGFYEKKRNRVRAMRWFGRQMKMKEADPRKRVKGVVEHEREITQRHFRENGFTRILQIHKGSPFNALFEAILVTAGDEAYMRSSQHGQGGYGRSA